MLYEDTLTAQAAKLFHTLAAMTAGAWRANSLARAARLERAKNRAYKRLCRRRGMAEQQRMAAYQRTQQAWSAHVARGGD